jgi:RNA polymerase sigma factor (TIGR02999 family)
MRHILVDRARRKRRRKRGGDRSRVDFDPAKVATAKEPDEVLAVNEALTGLAAADTQAAELVKLRHFAGFSILEAAEALNISSRSADRLWAFSRAWLRRAVGEL